MKYHELQVAAKPARKRVGRGISSGHGKTAGRGTKGQGARTGKKLGPSFDAGGHEHRLSAIPKLRGFKSKRAPAQVVYADQLNDLKSAKIDNFALFEAELIATPFHAVKIIAPRDKSRELTSKAEVCVAGVSQSVAAALAKNGGGFVKTTVPLPKSAKPKEEEPEKTAKPIAK